MRILGNLCAGQFEPLTSGAYERVAATMPTGGSDPYARAVAGLVTALEDGRLNPGDPVPAPQVATDLNLSPTPVREALAHLCGRGLLQRHRRHGYSVPPLAASDLVDLFDLQAALMSAPSAGNPLAAVLLRIIEIRLSPLVRRLKARGDPNADLMNSRPPGRAALAARRDRLASQAEPFARALREPDGLDEYSSDIV